MSQLPNLLRRLPYLFYALALILGCWRFLNEWAMVETTYSASPYAMEDSFGFMHTLGRSGAFLSGFSEAAYLIANGGIIHVLIAIYDKMKGPAE